MKSFAELLQEAARNSKLNQRELAVTAEMNYHHLNKVLRGKASPPKRSTVIKLARATGASEESLLLAADMAVLAAEGENRPISDQASVPSFVAATRAREEAFFGDPQIPENTKAKVAELIDRVIEIELNHAQVAVQSHREGKRYGSLKGEQKKG